MATPNYDIDYNDKRLVEVNNNKQAALTQNEATYNQAIQGADDKYDALINASKNHAEEQKKQQQAQTDFTIEQINQQKAQAKTDYIKEQSGSYVDWQKEKDSYGVGAEQRAAAGLAGAGYSESAQVSLYNTYQNRVATARDAYGRAVLNYDNAIKDARLQNSSILAEIAYNALQQQLQLSLEGFQYKNQLLIEQANKKLEIESMYHSQYMNILSQINAENELKEKVRQHQESMRLQQQQLAAQRAYQNAQLALDREKWEYEKQQIEAAKIAKPKDNNTSTTKGATGKTPKRDGGSARAAYGSRDAASYLEALIASGASKDKVSNEIAIALRDGEITNSEAQYLRNKFTPRGVQY